MINHPEIRPHRTSKLTQDLLNSFSALNIPWLSHHGLCRDAAKGSPTNPYDGTGRTCSSVGTYRMKRAPSQSVPQLDSIDIGADCSPVPGEGKPGVPELGKMSFRSPIPSLRNRTVPFPKLKHSIPPPLASSMALFGKRNDV